MNKQIADLLQQYKDLRLQEEDKLYLNEFIEKVENATKEKVKDFSETLHNYLRTMTHYDYLSNYGTSDNFNTVIERISNKNCEIRKFDDRLYLLVHTAINNSNRGYINGFMGYDITNGNVSDFACFVYNHNSDKFVNQIPIEKLEKHTLSMPFSSANLYNTILVINNTIDKEEKNMIDNLKEFLKDYQPKETVKENEIER